MHVLLHTTNDENHPRMTLLGGNLNSCPFACLRGLQQVSFAGAVKSGSAYGVLRPGAALVVWRRHQVAAMRSLGTKCCDQSPLG
jgi:hypothetical protein